MIISKEHMTIVRLGIFRSALTTFDDCSELLSLGPLRTGVPTAFPIELCQHRSIPSCADSKTCDIDQIG
jgi:hypothetical protein